MNKIDLSILYSGDCNIILRHKGLEIFTDHSKYLRIFKCPLWIAVNSGRTDILDALLECGVNPNNDNAAGLHLACKQNDMLMVSRLLYSGGNPNICNSNDENCLHIACKQNNYELVLLLFSYMKNFSACDDSGRTPIMYTSNKNIIEFLSAYTNLTIIDNYGDKFPVRCSSKANNFVL